MMKQKGQILLMSILLLSTVLTAGIVLTVILAKDLRQAAETSFSIKAFYAADSAIEWELCKTFNVPDIAPPVTIPGEFEFVLKNEIETENRIRAVGVSGNTKRGIEVKFSEI